MLPDAAPAAAPIGATYNITDDVMEITFNGPISLGSFPTPPTLWYTRLAAGHQLSSFSYNGTTKLQAQTGGGHTAGTNLRVVYDGGGGFTDSAGAPILPFSQAFTAF